MGDGRDRVRQVFVLAVALLGCAAGVAMPQNPAAEPRGLRFICEGAASPGYTLFAPLSSDTTYLIDLAGQVIQTWKSAFLPSGSVYLLDNGHVLRGANDPGLSGFAGGGQGGRFQEFDFDGKLVWDFTFNEGRLPHHDVAVLPNGNVLAIVWEARTADQARRAGRREGFIHPRGIWPDMLIEFEPLRPNGARIVWEWHMWDHLVQSADPTRDNYGDPSRHPERIDLNGDTAETLSPPANPVRDVFHTNAIAYNPSLDQIILSVPTFNEVWVIDHSTTTQEAAGTTGGRSGKGGDLLYRWGNPQIYGRGAAADRRLGFQHNAGWIPEGRPGAGHMMVFSNRTPGPNGAYTKVYEFESPVDAEGRYAVPASGPFGPTEPIWTYTMPDSYQANFVSGAERLENGNTLVSSGPEGQLFEVTSAGEIVWEYWSPYAGTFPSGGGSSSANWFTLFRATRIQLDHPAFQRRDLRPLHPQPPASSSTITGWGKCPRPFTVAGPFPDLSIRSSHTGNFGAGFDETYTVIITNNGAAPTTGTITVTDKLPVGLTFVSGTGIEWRCSSSGQIVTCTNSTTLSANHSSSLSLTVAVGSSADTSVKHTVSVSGEGDLNAINDSVSDATTVVTPFPVLAFTRIPLSAGHQAHVAVTMTTPFPHAVTGSLTLSFSSTAAIPLDDPAIQFATGGRTVRFTIPANDTQARFDLASHSGPLAFQSGTVAGTLAFTGSYTAGKLQGNFSGPADEDGLRIPLQAPAIQSIETSTEGGFAISILVLSTSREVTLLSLAFNTSPKVQISCGGATGCLVADTILTLDVAPLFTEWFRADSTFGGLAQLRLPLNIVGGVKGDVAVSLGNRHGVSNPKSFVLP